MNVTRLLIALGAILATPSGYAAESPTVTGTYELLVCKSTCSFANPESAFAKGVVVLCHDAMSSKEVERVDPFHFTLPNEKVRACFTGNILKDGESYVFGRRTGATSWALKGKKLDFSLMRSTDAGYDVEALIEGDAFSGKGVSWGAGAAAPDYEPDFVVGRRKGPPDITACASAQSPPAT